MNVDWQFPVQVVMISVHVIILFYTNTVDKVMNLDWHFPAQVVMIPVHVLMYQTISLYLTRS